MNKLFLCLAFVWSLCTLGAPVNSMALSETLTAAETQQLEILMKRFALLTQKYSTVCPAHSDRCIPERLEEAKQLGEEVEKNISDLVAFYKKKGISEADIQEQTRHIRDNFMKVLASSVN